MSLIKDDRKIRRRFDCDDPFFSAHQIITINRPRRKTPSWMKSDEEVRKFLLYAFPKFATDKKQRASAGRWLRIIQLYFRGKYNAREVSEEIGISYMAVKSLVRSIRRVSVGRRANGGGFKKRASPETSFRGAQNAHRGEPQTMAPVEGA